MALIQETWAKVKEIDETYEAQGVMLFKHVFTIAPDALPLFPFKDEPDLYNSEGLKKHGRNVMKHLDRAINNWEAEKPKLEQLGKRHSGYGVHPPHFEVVGEALIKTLEQSLEWGFTAEVKQAYLHLWACIDHSMKQGM